MEGEYHRWYSPRVGRDMELLVFGYSGAPVVVFPTSGGRFYEWKDFGMVEALQDKIAAGYIQLFCLDSDGHHSWYNQWLHPADRIRRHNAWEGYVTDEFLPFVQARNGNPFLIFTGTSFGAYLAVNYTLKHPALIKKVIGLSGSYTIHNLLDGYFDANGYFNCPVDYLPNLHDPWYLDQFRQIEWVLVSSDNDLSICQKTTRQLSDQLRAKGINVWLDYWGNNTGHDWSYWRQMIRQYL